MTNKLFKQVPPFDDTFSLDIVTVADGRTYAQVSHPENKGDALACEFLQSQHPGSWLKPLEWTAVIDGKRIVKSNPNLCYPRGVWQWLFVKG